MDESGFEDLLFGDLDTQLTSDDNLLDESDDDILFATGNENLNPWAAADTAAHTPTVADMSCGQHVHKIHMRHSQEQSGCDPSELTERPIRDRF